MPTAERRNVAWTGFYLNWLWQLPDSAGLEAGKNS